MGGILAVANPRDPCPPQWRLDDNRARLRDWERRGLDLVRLALVVGDRQPKRDRRGGFRLAKVEQEEDHGAPAAFKRPGVRRRSAPSLVEAQHHGRERRRIEHRARFARARLDRVDDVAAVVAKFVRIIS